MGQRLSVDQWAKRHGITRQSAYERIRAHKIKLVNGKIDGDEADRIWAASMNAVQRANATGGSIAAAAADDGEPKLSSLASTQLQRERIRIQKEALALQKAKGLLVPIDDVNIYIAGMITEAKDILLRIGSELQTALAREKDPKKCRALVDDKIHAALLKLADYRPNLKESK